MLPGLSYVPERIHDEASQQASERRTSQQPFDGLGDPVHARSCGRYGIWRASQPCRDHPTRPSRLLVRERSQVIDPGLLLHTAHIAMVAMAVVDPSVMDPTGRNGDGTDGPAAKRIRLPAVLFAAAIACMDAARWTCGWPREKLHPKECQSVRSLVVSRRRSGRPDRAARNRSGNRGPWSRGRGAHFHPWAVR